MGSRGGSDEIPAAAAATANDAERAEDAVEPSVVPSEAVPTQIEEEGQVDPAIEKEIEDDLLKGLEADRKAGPPNKPHEESTRQELQKRMAPEDAALPTEPQRRSMWVWFVAAGHVPKARKHH